MGRVRRRQAGTDAGIRHNVGVKRLIIDTDTAQDDCVALLVGLLDPEAQLEAITMVAGNVGFERQVHNAYLTLNMAGRLGEVPIYLGCPRPMVRPWASAENVHGDGTGGLQMSMDGLTHESEHAVHALLRLVDANPGQLDIVCIGPLTNIAVATVMDPTFPSKVRSLTIMGGSNNGRGNIIAAAEFNFYVDPEAAKTVFEAGFDITVIPWDRLTLRDATFGRPQLDRIRALGTPLASFFWSAVEHTLAFDEANGIPGSTHPDSLSVATLLHPELVTASAPYNVQIETASDLTRGYAAMSWGVHGLEPNATVIESIDADAFYGFISGMLARDITPSRPVRGL